jgi:hypothetical protein
MDARLTVIIIGGLLFSSCLKIKKENSSHSIDKPATTFVEIDIDNINKEESINPK